MKTSKFFFLVTCFLILNQFQAHIPGVNVSFVKINTTAVSNNNLRTLQTTTLAKFYAGPKEKKTLFSKPLKLSFRLSNYLLLNVSYN